MYRNIDGRSGYLICDAPTTSCRATSEPFVARVGGELPDGWVEDTRVAAHMTPGRPAHYCPDHAYLLDRPLARRAA